MRKITIELSDDDDWNFLEAANQSSLNVDEKIMEMIKMNLITKRRQKKLQSTLRFYMGS